MHGWIYSELRRPFCADDQLRDPFCAVYLDLKNKEFINLDIDSVDLYEGTRQCPTAELIENITFKIFDPRALQSNHKAAKEQ